MAGIVPLRSAFVGRGAPNARGGGGAVRSTDDDVASALLAGRSFYFEERSREIDLEGFATPKSGVDKTQPKHT